MKSRVTVIHETDDGVSVYVLENASLMAETELGGCEPVGRIHIRGSEIVMGTDKELEEVR